MENRVEDWIWQLGIYSIWRMNHQILPRFLSNSLKKWKFEVYLGYYNYPDFPFDQRILEKRVNSVKFIL